MEGIKLVRCGTLDNEAIVHRRVPVTFKEKLINRAMWWPTQRVYLSATRISDKKLARFVDEIRLKKIKWIVGYCGSLEYVADYILKNNIGISCVKLVWSTSSPLTKIVREKLENAFNCPVMDQYGCCEMGNIAVQKPMEDCLTVNNDYVWVDIVNTEGANVRKGDLGDVCITDLNTLEFPLIKYRLGEEVDCWRVARSRQTVFKRLHLCKDAQATCFICPAGMYWMVLS